MMKAKKDSYEFSGGEIRVWLEQEAVHIKAIDNSVDPVEMTKEEALELAEALRQLALQIV